ncbi:MULTISPECIES: hypothetical protein [Gracilibacillus]|uniref:hypothetical protein n=1 Tax=Gracilibacillus TaxID=74385 RepID=UPI00082495AE|nr:MULTISPECIES: hypothetical protein [Gracilibacillus]
MKHTYLFFAAIFILHIYSLFFPYPWLKFTLGLLAIVILLISFRQATKLFQILGSSFLLIGLILLPFTDLSWGDIISGMGDNLSLLTLLAVLPWMNSVVAAGRFDKLLQRLLRGNVQHLGQLYQRSSTVMMALTSFLNVSAATLAQDVLVDNLKPIKQRIASKFIMMVSLRGYSLALPWSPLEMAMGMILLVTGVGFGELLPWMIAISVIMYVLDSLWGRWFFKRYNYPAPPQQQTSNIRQNRSSMLQLIIALATFLFLVIAIGNVFDLDFLLTVILLVPPFAFCWALAMGRWKSFWTIGWNRWKNTLNTMHNFIVLFVTLALFTNALNGSPAQDMLQQPIIALADKPLYVLIIIQLLFVFLSMFGVHPLATIGILSGISGILMEVLSPLSLAVSLMIATVATVPIGTYGLVVTITSMSLRQSPYYITYYNMIYSLVFGIVGIIFAYFLI